MSKLQRFFLELLNGSLKAKDTAGLGLGSTLTLTLRSQVTIPSKAICLRTNDLYAV